jgi:serine/threonine-protein kinase
MVLDPDTPNERIKVMDFGLAQMVERSPGNTKETIRPEFAVGTPGYMAPEQVRGDAVDHRADLYSVGAILYQLLTGRLPFAGTTVMEVLMAQASDEIPTFADIRITDMVPAGVEEVVRWSLALKPEDRPQIARELFEAYDEAVTNALRGLTAAPTPAMDEPAGPAPAATPPAAAAVPEPGSAADATVEQLEAFMPEQLAIFKLRAFVEEVGGKIVENAPGLIRVQMQVNRSAMAQSGKRKTFLSWLGLRPKYGTIDMELRMKKKDVKNQAVIQITVLLRPSGGGPVPDNPDWRARCNIITSALKAYLMSS